MSTMKSEELFAKVQAATLINEGIDEIDNGAEGIDIDKFFDDLTNKYRK